MRSCVQLLTRGARAAAMLLACGQAAGAQTMVGEVVGRAVASIAVTIDGVAVRDPQVLDLIEQAVGTPFSPAAVRESIFHLVNVGRYDNVRVAATLAGEGVALEFALVPRRQVSAVRFRGTLGLSEGTLRDALDPRLRDDPTSARVATAERALAQLFQDRGFLRATVAGSVTDVAGTLDRSEIVFDIDCGPAARIARVVADIDAPNVFGNLADRLGLVTGRPYDRPAVQSRLERELRTFRDKGYLEARVTAEAEDQGDGSLVASLSAHLGPIVEVRFEGDPLPRDVREAQVPVRREASVDEDLLEDSSATSSDTCRTRGTRAPPSPTVEKEMPSAASWSSPSRGGRCFGSVVFGCRGTVPYRPRRWNRSSG